MSSEPELQITEADWQNFQAFVDQIVSAETDDLLELAQRVGCNSETAFAGADLSGTNLSGNNLSRFNLSRADFSGADLSNANLSEADLSYANLSNANLTGANLSKTNLNWANFSRATLNGEHLRLPNLNKADLIGMELTEKGNGLVMTFEEVQNTNIIFKNFNLENLDDSLTTTKTPFMLCNIVFRGETPVQDSFNVMDANLMIAQVFNRNSVTFLIDSDNDVMDFDASDDVIDGQGGNDFLKGLGGDKSFRGGAGDDILWNGTGADILDGRTGNNWLTGGVDADTFRLCRGGLSQVTDFQVDKDRIGSPADIRANQVVIERGTGLNSSSTLIRFKPDGSVLMSLSNITASSLTTDIFLPSTSSLIRDSQVGEDRIGDILNGGTGDNSGQTHKN